MLTEVELILNDVDSREEALQQAITFVPDSKHQYVYYIWHTCQIKPSTFYIQVPYPPTVVIHLLIAHLQFGASQFAFEDDMSNEDLGVLLTTFYGGKILSKDEIREFELRNVPMYSINLLENWNTVMCSGMFKDVLDIRTFHREGLKETFDNWPPKYTSMENA